ncbi:MAG: hypothetical protein ACYCVN_11850 [Acidimicrobiales bacterium]
MRARANRAAQAFEDLAERRDARYDTAAGRVLFDLELGALRPLLAGTAGPRLGVGSGRFAAALGIEVSLSIAVPGRQLECSLVADTHGAPRSRCAVNGELTLEQRALPASGAVGR